MRFNQFEIQNSKYEIHYLQHKTQIHDMKLKLRITCMQVSSQSWPNRIMTRRSSSARIAWSTAQPECKWGNRYDIFFFFLISWNPNWESLPAFDSNATVIDFGLDCDFYCFSRWLHWAWTGRCRKQISKPNYYWPVQFLLANKLLMFIKLRNCLLTVLFY